MFDPYAKGTPWWKYTGNDHDGIYGERSGEEGYQGFVPDQRVVMLLRYDALTLRNVWQRICWWFRNPMHNACFISWRKPDGWFINLPFLYFGHRPNKPAGGETPEVLEWLASRDGVFAFPTPRRYPGAPIMWDAWPLRWYYHRGS